MVCPAATYLALFVCDFIPQSDKGIQIHHMEDYIMFKTSLKLSVGYETLQGSLRS